MPNSYGFILLKSFSFGHQVVSRSFSWTQTEMADIKKYASEGILRSTKKLSVFHSEPNLKKHPLLELEDEETPHTFHEYIFAAETLENIVNDGNFVGTIKSRYKWFSPPKDSDHVTKAVSDRVLKLVYGTMKCMRLLYIDLPYLDSILVKTQFLVFNNQFLDALGLVKVMLFDLMKHHFNYQQFPGIDYKVQLDQDEKYQQACIDLVQDLEETLYDFRVHLAAAYARLRIERGARGNSTLEQMNNILPAAVRKKEEMAIDVIKTLRINSLKTTPEEVALMLRNQGHDVELKKWSQLSAAQKEYFCCLSLEATT